MLKKLTLISLLLGLSTTVLAVTDPSSVTMKIYGVALSTATDCSNATVVGYTAAGTDYDFKTNPSIFSGTVAPGTYQCVVLYMSPIVNFKPLASDGANCTAATSYHLNICNTGNGCTYATASPDANNVLVYGAASTVPTAGPNATTTTDKVLLFLSTASTGTGNDAFRQPTAGNLTRGITLTSAFTVTAGNAGTFVVNFNGKVDGSQSPCGLNAPVFGFR